ncbi:MAG: hypothetical protein ACR5LF_11390 [Symbiopectobacterium sp.]
MINGQPKRVATMFDGATDTAVALGITPVGIVDSWKNRCIAICVVS